MTRRLTISIRSDGSITALASGTPGPACLDAIEQLRVLLNAEVSDSRPTPEFSASVASAKIRSEESNHTKDWA